ncbi:10768_t:CDS:2, partial [Racocetra persica]
MSQSDINQIDAQELKSYDSDLFVDTTTSLSKYVKDLRGPMYRVRQERDYVIDTYFKHLTELEKRYKQLESNDKDESEDEEKKHVKRRK